MSEVWYEIRTIDGRVLSRTHSIHWMDKWQWITRVIQGETSCNYEDIDTDNADGDLITVDGTPFARVRRLPMEDYSATAEYRDAMGERALDQAIEDANWERLDAAAKICAILAKLPQKELDTVLTMVNEFYLMGEDLKEEDQKETGG